MNQANNIKSDIGQHYFNFMKSLGNTDKIDFDLNDNKVSIAFYNDLFRIKEAQYKYVKNVARGIRHTLADIFQDLVAHYIRRCLHNNIYEVKMEVKKGKYRPDILIYKNDNPFFIVEVKTNIGWSRGSQRNWENDRIKPMSKEFGIPHENIIYVFLNPFNSGNDFLNKYIDKEKEIPTQRDTLTGIYSRIYPLFTGTDIKYWELPNEIKNNKNDLIDQKLLDQHAEKMIITRFELVLERILK